MPSAVFPRSPGSSTPRPPTSSQQTFLPDDDYYFFPSFLWPSTRRNNTRDIDYSIKKDLGLTQAKQSALAKLAMSSNAKDIRAPSSSSPTHSNKSPAISNPNGEPPPPPVSHPHHDALLPPPAMAHAIRSMNDLNGPIALRDRSSIAYSDTPPAMRSVVSTAPNSPRMYV